MRSLVCGALLAFSLVTNACQFRANLLFDPGWPDWSAEVASWRRDPSRELRVWPPGWSLKLEPARSSHAGELR